MTRQNLILHNHNKNLRAVIKTKHGRVMYLELSKNADKFIVKECYYLDRFRSGKYYAVPKKLITRKFFENELLNIVETQLDRKFYGLEYDNSISELSTDEFISVKLNELGRGYKFLIFVGDGNTIGGLPNCLTTRLANRIHRKIYLKIKYYKDGLGVIEDCHYYDRQYKARNKVIPQMLTSVFVPYNREAIINMVNRELDCDFTDIIIADNSINIESNNFALCGNI